MKFSYEYLIQFLIGGILFTTLYHFSKEKNTLMSSIIPSFPLFFLITLMYIIYFNANLGFYLKNICVTNTLLLLFVLMIYFTFIYFKNIYISVIASMTLYFTILYYCISNKIIK